MPREYALILLALVCLIGDFLLVVLGHDLPPMLESVTLATVGAAAGATIPRSPGGGLR
ncbi:hypothetical protein JHN55_07650 [Streptomyces sp. MBT56]|uniref:hypothetical protein n=1 Tax=unclassified Streptomyces TaxID=2593676 RepID=UPI00190A009B|nr:MULTISPECIES: hypothetical protein [unclassified Streptomyces]MBK3548191.1 hypothetical protein [Streptomyces sp. MBT60]MBK3556408.1 hypothetical protein [Streptomyces sp. MBT56]MBK3582409.1 hypothetical protein [Streptomyces sp. MBT57]MBK6047823.1 hypothetical protein [Streptomyces sp. MBT55]